MMKSCRYVEKLSSEQKIELNKLLILSKGTLNNRIRVVLLSDSGYCINEISDILHLNRNTVSIHITLFEDNGINGLKPKKGRGRKTILNKEEQKKAIKIAEKHPRKLKNATNEIKNVTGKKISTWTLKRLLKKNNIIWKRVRKSLKSKQDPEKVEQAKVDLANLEELKNNKDVDVYYFDESGFDLTPTVPYEWQKSGRDNTTRIPSSNSIRINVLGFMDKENNLVPFVSEGSVNSSITVNCFNKFSETITSDTVVIIDNASVHTSNEFKDNINKWNDKGLYLYFLPSYSPEFNLIEILWRKMKYEWMPVSAYTSMNTLREAINDLLIGFGSTYKINFA